MYKILDKVFNKSTGGFYYETATSFRVYLTV